MTEKLAQQMRWHKNGKHYRPEKMIIHLMVKHGNILTGVTQWKLWRLEMYVLRWQQMDSILTE